jgi:hypothetical protein
LNRASELCLPRVQSERLAWWLQVQSFWDCQGRKHVGGQSWPVVSVFWGVPVHVGCPRACGVPPCMLGAPVHVGCPRACWVPPSVHDTRQSTTLVRAGRGNSLEGRLLAAERASGSREGEQQGTIYARCSLVRRGRWQHAREGARGAAEHAHTRDSTGSREGLRQGAIPACTEAGIEKCDNILSWGAWTRAGAATQARGAAERARSGVRTGGREGKRPWCGDEREARGSASEPRKCPKDQPSCLPASAARTAAPSAELRSASATRSRYNNLFGLVDRSGQAVW